MPLSLSLNLVKFKTCQMGHVFIGISSLEQAPSEAPALWSLPSIEDIALEAVQNKLILSSRLCHVGSCHQTKPFMLEGRGMLCGLSGRPRDFDRVRGFRRFTEDSQKHNEHAEEHVVGSPRKHPQRKDHGSRNAPGSRP